MVDLVLTGAGAPPATESATLRRLIGSVIALTAFLVVLFNVLGAPDEIKADTVRLLLAPQVSVVTLIGVVALLTVFISGIRWVQVALFIGTGIGSAFEATPGNLTSFIWFLVGLLLGWEYGYFRSRGGIKAGMISIGFLMVWAITITTRSDRGFALLGASLAAGSLLAGFGWVLIVMRQSELRRRQTELEQAVADRTRELADALDEQKLLLAELHHRTKNNLQLVSSMLGFEGSTMRGGYDPGAVEHAQRRIHALGRVHELLYSRAGRAEVDLEGFLADYLNEMSMIVDSGGLTVDSSISVGRAIRTDLAIRLGLILNEIILNAMEHAGGSSISVTITDSDGSLVLEASDDGPGLNGTQSERVGLGIHIIQSMAERLGGAASIESGNGTRWRVTIPLDRAESQWD